MRGKTLQVAALAAGAVAAPSNRLFGGRQEDAAPIERRQYDNSTTIAPSSYESTSTSTTTIDLSSTVYTTVNATVTICTETSSCSASTSSSLTTVAPTTYSSASSSNSSSSVLPTFSSSTNSSSSSAPSSSSATSSSSTGSTSSVGYYSVFATASISGLTTSTSQSTSSSPSSSTAITYTSHVYSEAHSSLESTTITTLSSVVDDASTASSAATPPPAPVCTLLPGAPITNEEQVGDSIWGTLCQPYFPQWLGDSPTVPWGSNRTVNNSDATVANDVPITNVTRRYNFTVSRGQISPDGVLRDVILVNGQYPGPLMEANWGDWFEVTVNNNISNPFEGTALHWHGQLQKTTPWEDGVPGAGQCPIAPGHSFTYRFQAELHGSSWYHAHYSAQFTAGVLGPMIVHGPSSLPYDFDVGPIMLSDWYHIPYFSIVADAVGTNYSLIPPTSDAVLINGRGQFDCSKRSYDNSSQWLGSNLKSNLSWSCVEKTPLAAFRFQSGKVHRLRLMNTGSNGVQKFSMDNHNLTVIAYDFVPIVPYTTDHITLGVGQRADVLVQADHTPEGAIWMRSSAPGGEVCGGSSSPVTIAAVYYELADVTQAPTSTSDLYYDGTCVNDPLNMTVPAYAITPSANHWQQDLGLTLDINETGHFEFNLNGQAWHTNYNVPLLEQVANGNMTFEPQWNVYNFYENKSIILNITNNMPLVHPFHMHGHNFYILNVGDNSTQGSANVDKRQAGPRFQNGATWDGSIVNANNPMRRDGILIPPYGFAAIQFELDNPGVWPFHCHVAWHLSGGQGMNIVYKTDNITAIPKGKTDETCVDWDWYAANNGPVDQIDSGA